MQVLDEVLNIARTNGCSDIHITPKQGILFRNNGQLIPYVAMFSEDELREMILGLCSEKQKTQLDQFEDLDFGFVDSKGLRYRVNVYHQQQDICAAMRIINDEIKGIEELGLPVILKELALRPRGLILFTGPTGSGKSTSLAAMIDFINSQRDVHILTIEDPIEYVYETKRAMIHQREIGVDVKDFNTALKSAMREDPDVILVGEMRDYETMAAVITLAETGHLVFSTLHTSGAASTIDRIIDVFPAAKQAQLRSQLSSVLEAVISQTLLADVRGGRSAALEIMIATDAIRSLIREAKTHQIPSLIQTGIQDGMRTLNRSLADLIQQGRITREIAMEVSDDQDELLAYLG